MSLKTRLAAVSCALIVSAVGASAAAAAPVALSLPQSAAFSVLGYSCGGIQEKAYATGFDAASGYPTGAVYLSTRCGGSGRGGGYHTTTYTAWAGVTWDYGAAVVSYRALSPAPAVDPAFSAFDRYGNEVYNQSDNAYLVLASGFVPAPRVTAVSPTLGPAAGGTKVTITGAGFTGATRVSFGGTAAASFTVSSATSITATSPAAGAGMVDVTVANPGGTSAAVATDQFTFVAVPVVSGLSPKIGPVSGGTEVTITGAHLGDATRVDFGGVATGFWVNSDSSITAYSPPGEAAGAVDVKVTSAGGRSVRTAADRFTYKVTPPTVTGLDPNLGPQDGGTEVTITGTNLTAAAEVDFGGVPAAFYVDSDTSITAYSPAAGAGTVDVTVTTPDGTSTASAADQFTFVAAPVPAVASVGPNAGPVDGGSWVTITGAGFTGATEVDFGGAAAYFVVDSDTSIEAWSPPGTGVVDVTVTTLGGTSAATPDDQFTYLAAPSVSGVSPGSGPADGGSWVTITGAGFTGATEVDFGGAAAYFVVDSDTSIEAWSPAGAGTVDVAVTTIGGTSAASANDQFTFVDAPSVSGVSPNAGPVDGGSSVTIAGAGFTGATEVDFGGVAADFVVDSDSSITAVSPPGAGAVDVTVTTPGGTSGTTADDQFTYG